MMSAPRILHLQRLMNLNFLTPTPKLMLTSYQPQPSYSRLISTTTGYNLSSATTTGEESGKKGETKIKSILHNAFPSARNVRVQDISGILVVIFVLHYN